MGKEKVTFGKHDMEKLLNQLSRDLDAANDHIATLEDDLAINKNAYSTWHKRCGVVEAERDKLRDALRWAMKYVEPPMKEKHKQERMAEGLPPYDHRGKGFESEHKQAAALLCEAEEDADV